ncbi:hypothetical protein P4C99_22160, partial [Pontiellaceae bacterium B1224]|nr:hypothetical protein [Pontiellaceae bacterium B1224]
MPDSIVSETITATNLLDRVVELQSVHSTVTGIEAEVVGFRDDGARRPQRNWTIRLKSAEGLAVGKINGQIKLNFSSGTVNVPIIGTVKPMIQVMPERIELGS